MSSGYAPPFYSTSGKLPVPLFFKGKGLGVGRTGRAVAEEGKHCKAPPLSWKCSARGPALPHFVHRQPSPHASSHMNSYHALKNGNSILKNSRKQSILRTVFCEDRWPYDTHTPRTPEDINNSHQQSRVLIYIYDF